MASVTLVISDVTGGASDGGVNIHLEGSVSIPVVEGKPYQAAPEATQAQRLALLLVAAARDTCGLLNENYELKGDE